MNTAQIQHVAADVHMIVVSFRETNNGIEDKVVT